MIAWARSMPRRPIAPGVDAEGEAIEAAANELDPPEDDGSVTFYTGPTEADRVAKALQERGWTVTAANQIWRAKNPVSPDDDKRAQVEALPEAVDGDDDVQSTLASGYRTTRHRWIAVGIRSPCKWSSIRTSHARWSQAVPTTPQKSLVRCPCPRVTPTVDV